MKRIFYISTLAATALTFSAGIALAQQALPNRKAPSTITDGTTRISGELQTTRPEQPASFNHPVSFADQLNNPI